MNLKKIIKRISNVKGNDLADYAISKLGTPYFYGAKMQTLTRDLMNRLHASYPSTVTMAYMTIAEQQGQIGKINVDCSGLIGAYRGKHLGSSQLYSSAYKRMPISQVNDFARGTVLWKQGHAGVYIGDGMCVEAKGIRYGTVKTPVKTQSGYMVLHLEIWNIHIRKQLLELQRAKIHMRSLVCY